MAKNSETKSHAGDSRSLGAGKLRLYKNKRKRKLNRPETGQVKVSKLGIIILGPRWAEPAGFKPGDTVKIRREGSSCLILAK